MNYFLSSQGKVKATLKIQTGLTKLTACKTFAEKITNAVRL